MLLVSPAQVLLCARDTPSCLMVLQLHHDKELCISQSCLNNRNGPYRIWGSRNSDLPRTRLHGIAEDFYTSVCTQEVQATPWPAKLRLALPKKLRLDKMTKGQRTCFCSQLARPYALLYIVCCYLEACTPGIITQSDLESFCSVHCVFTIQLPNINTDEPLW